MHGMEYTAEVEAEERERLQKELQKDDERRKREIERQLKLYSEIQADPSEVEGEIVVSEEVLEAKDALDAFDTLTEAIREGKKQQRAQRPLTKEQLMIKRSKAKKAKRKRGGPR